jgi:hypothetical protein
MKILVDAEALRKVLELADVAIDGAGETEAKQKEYSDALEKVRRRFERMKNGEAMKSL